MRPTRFPPPDSALAEPNGLLAAGGDLEPDAPAGRLRARNLPVVRGRPADPLVEPRPALGALARRLKVSRSLRRSLIKGGFEVRIDTAFDRVVAAARSRAAAAAAHVDHRGDGARLQRLASAWLGAFVRAWRDGQFVGGLYGVAIGRVFFGESMFTRATDASKVALVRAVEHLRGRISSSSIARSPPRT